MAGGIANKCNGLRFDNKGEQTNLDGNRLLFAWAAGLLGFKPTGLMLNEKFMDNLDSSKCFDVLWRN